MIQHLVSLCGKPIHRVASLVRRLRDDPRGNVFMIMGFALVPMTFATGMTIDYSRAAKLQTKINAVADAAALAAVSKPMLSQTPTNAATRAVNMFYYQADGTSGFVRNGTGGSYSNSSTTTYNAFDGTMTVKIRDTNTTGFQRVAEVTYAAQSTNIFARLLGMTTIAIGGKSTATATTAPNIDFYVMLDTSPSMAIAATTAGINTMVANTSAQGGCAFGCHQTGMVYQSNPNDGNYDNLGNPYEGGRMIDNYKLARNLNVTLRTDLVRTAAQSMIDTAQSAAANNSATYRFMISKFDVGFTKLQSMTTDLAAAKTAAGNATMLTTFRNNQLTQGNNNNDTDTNETALVNGLTPLLSIPGNGTNNSGDRPQGILFFVTDGVRDEMLNGNRIISPLLDCQSAKDFGFKVAIVYTTYLPLPTNGFYNDNVAPFQPQIATHLKDCASPGLFYEVSTDGDVTEAMRSVFLRAVETARLTQ